MNEITLEKLRCARSALRIARKALATAASDFGGMAYALHGTSTQEEAAREGFNKTAKALSEMRRVERGAK